MVKEKVVKEKGRCAARGVTRSAVRYARTSRRGAQESASRACGKAGEAAVGGWWGGGGGSAAIPAQQYGSVVDTRTSQTGAAARKERRGGSVRR